MSPAQTTPPLEQSSSVGCWGCGEEEGVPWVVVDASEEEEVFRMGEQLSHQDPQSHWLWCNQLKHMLAGLLVLGLCDCCFE